jgi:uncharacterized membrane protein YbhN (UPF0104 family)
MTSERGLAELDSREDDGPEEIELTYSTLRDINRARLAIGMLAVCIIQVLTNGWDHQARKRAAKNLKLE